jgi:hypothetical protein
MSVMVPEVEEIIAAWRSGRETAADWESPAGPLFSSEYAESELTMSFPEDTEDLRGTCTASREGRLWVQCC